MTDPYRLTTASGTYADPSAKPSVDHNAETIGGPLPVGEPLRVVTGSGVVRTLLWVLLVISAIGNMVASYAAAGTAVHLAFGAVTAVCLTALVAQRLRGRR
ncbi:hypothetical protein G5C60_40145 [Streptomyces sp. HC44]|uniref:Uncharacterized protein n=1 Tax=Streptomyces scabichelini TaxID=2711217 RepID=A0A6G4VID6_9ACTN|nr:hypothetical protein [Streptomyces scabichelini]NGO13645.1 hypothetical protein [Streptomyces scabichelini]